MQKPDSLREALTVADPELGRDPDRLLMWVEKGRIRAPMTASRSFGYEYTLHVVIVSFEGHPSVLFLAINNWLRTNQPDLLAAGGAGAGRGYAFDADIMDNRKVDLELQLELTEQVALHPREDGGWNLEHLAEPPMFPDDEPLSDPPAPLRQVWWKDELLVP